MDDGFLLLRLPDGTDISRRLDQSSITIGSTHDCDVVLDDPTVSRRHAIITVESGRVGVADQSSEHGSFVNDRRLEPGLDVAVSPSDRIRFGQVEARYTEPLATTLSDEVVEAGPLRLALIGKPEPFEPGWLSNGKVALQYHGADEDTFDVTVTGVPNDWVRLSASQVRLAQDAVAVIDITFALPREETSLAGEIPFAVVARSQSDAVTHAQVEGYLTILARDTATFALLPERGHGPFRVALHSHARERRTYRLSGEDLEESLDYEFDPATLEVEAGASSTSELTVKPRVRPYFGLERVNRFQVTATPTEPGLAQSKTLGELVVKPKISLAWLVLAFVGVALLIGLYSQMCSLGNLPGCAVPDIEFKVSPGQVQQGGSATLAWQVAGAESVEILPAPGAVDSSGRLPVVVNETTTYTLRAVGESGRGTERSLTIAVTDLAPYIEKFEAQPPSFVRGQLSEITLSWVALNADQVTISNVEGVFMASGSVSTAAPTDTESYTLLARNASGSSSEVLTVAVVDAGCVVASMDGAAVQLREGPGEAYRSIGAVVPGTAVAPISRDSSGDWGYVTIDNRNGWLRRQDLSCQVSAELPTADPNSFPSTP